MRDETEEDPAEIEASKHELKLRQIRWSSIGCMVNGAGLAMGTMDINKITWWKSCKLPRCRRRSYKRESGKSFFYNSARSKCKS